ncbi:MAG TPA: VanZ family protein [Candidatus Acidoferrales bacterium]
MRWLRHWWPALVWAVAIWTFSTAVFSAEGTSRLITPLLRWLLPDASAATLLALHGFIRKAAHVVEYFILSLLVLRGIREGRAGWRWTWAAATVAVVAMYAALDEVHQAFVPARGGSAVDVMLDTLGAVLAQVWAWWRARRQNVLAPESGKR